MSYKTAGALDICLTNLLLISRASRDTRRPDIHLSLVGGNNFHYRGRLYARERDRSAVCSFDIIF